MINIKKFLKSTIGKTITVITIIASVVTIAVCLTGYLKQKKLDTMLSQSYETEIYNFYSQFRLCLNWTLPRGENIDEEVNYVFNYGKDITKGFDMNKVNEKSINKIFNVYDFSKPMINFFNPDNSTTTEYTGFNCLLGDLDYFQSQTNEHIKKYGGFASPELTNRLEYIQRIAKAEASSIRLNLHSKEKISQQNIDSLSNFFIHLRDDVSWLNENFKSGVYPVLIGVVQKSDPVEGEITFEWHYGKY